MVGDGEGTGKDEGMSEQRKKRSVWIDSVFSVGGSYTEVFGNGFDFF